MNQLQALLQTATNRNEVFASKIVGATLLFSYATDGSVSVNKRGQNVLLACKSKALSGSNTATFQIKKMDQGVWVVTTDSKEGFEATQETFIKA